MYFWNTRQLALDLEEGDVTEKDQMWYLLAYLIFTGLSVILCKWVPSEYGSSKLGSIADLGVTIIGLLACYQANSRGDGKEFVVRYICMSWPVMWRVLAVCVPAAAVFGLLIGAVAPHELDFLAEMGGTLVVGANFVFVRRWLFRVSTARVGAGTSAE